MYPKEKVPSYNYHFTNEFFEAGNALQRATYSSTINDVKMALAKIKTLSTEIIYPNRVKDDFKEKVEEPIGDLQKILYGNPGKYEHGLLCKKHKVIWKKGSRNNDPWVLENIQNVINNLHDIMKFIAQIARDQKLFPEQPSTEEEWDPI